MGNRLIFLYQYTNRWDEAVEKAKHTMVCVFKYRVEGYRQIRIRNPSVQIQGWFLTTQVSYRSCLEIVSKNIFILTVPQTDTGG